MSIFFFLLSIALAIQFYGSMEILIVCSKSLKHVKILMGIAPNLQNALVILRMLIPPIYKQEISFHFLMFSSIHLSSDLQFSLFYSFTSFVDSQVFDVLENFFGKNSLLSFLSIQFIIQVQEQVHECQFFLYQFWNLTFCCIY